jgi:hypothetical protein
MTLPSADQSVLRRYLLGTATAESQNDLETRLFSDDRIVSERLSIAEDELVSDYVQNALTDAERQDFEKHFLCTEGRRAKLEFARALHAYAGESGVFERSDAARRSETARESRWAWLRRPVLSPAWAVAAAALLLLVVQVPRFASSSGAAVSGSNVVAISLTSGRTRAAGGELTRVRLNTASQIVRLQLEPESTRFTTYRASLFQVEDDTLIAEMRLTPRSDAGSSEVTLTLPAESLAEADYYVKLQGISPGASPVPLQRYDFRVLRD